MVVGVHRLTEADMQNVARKAEASLAQLRASMLVPGYVDRASTAAKAKDAIRAAELASRAASALQTAKVLASALGSDSVV